MTENKYSMGNIFSSPIANSAGRPALFASENNQSRHEGAIPQRPIFDSGYSNSLTPSYDADPSLEPPHILEILVAEDNFANQLIAKTLLTRAGHHVTTVNNGHEAVQAARIKMFDLILMDIEMPVMNGIEATEAIRHGQGPNQNAQIIALTAYGSPSEKYTYKHSGIDYVLTKPFRMMDLSYILERKHNMGIAQQTTAPTPTAETVAPILGPEAKLTSGPLVHIDENTLGTLIKGAGIRGLVPVIKAYWRSAYALLSHMQDAHQTWDRDGLQKSAHALKGASVNIGLLEVSRLAAQLQNARPDHVTSQLEDLELAMTQARKALNAYLARFIKRSA